MSAEAHEALERWGGTGGLRLIGARENAVYEVTLPQGRAALRLHRRGYQGADAIRSELWWCAELAAVGVPVPRALPALDGELLVRLPSGRHASVIEWIEGPPFGTAGVPLAGSRAAQVARFHALGDLVAQLHDGTDRLVLPDWFRRPRWDIDGLTGPAPFWGRFWEHPALDDAGRRTLTAARDHVRAALTAHLAEGGDFGLIHADVLRENVLMAPGQPMLIDFDDSGFGFRGYDLGTMLSQTLREPDLPHLARALVDGYAARRPVARQLIPVFTLARCCASVGWVMPRLAPGDPVHASHLARALDLAPAVLDGGPDWWE